MDKEIDFESLYCMLQELQDVLEVSGVWCKEAFYVQVEKVRQAAENQKLQEGK
jgi:hypothetical protein